MTNRGATAITGRRHVTARERQVRAVELRVAGQTLDEIAATLGYRSRGAVHDAIEACLARREKPPADQLAAIHMDRLEHAVRRVMGRLVSPEELSVKQIAALTLSLTRLLAAQARYVDVYSSAQGMGPVVSLLEQLLSSPPEGVDPDDPMTVSIELPAA